MRGNKLVVFQRGICTQIIQSSLHYAPRAMGGMTLRQKKEELESESSHKSDICSIQKNEVRYLEIDFRSHFPYKGVFFTKVVKANIIAFIKTKILRPLHVF